MTGVVPGAEPHPAAASAPGLEGGSAGCEHGRVSAATTSPAASGAEVLAARPAPDRFMRRVLRIDDRAERLAEDELRTAFQTSIAMSAIRCIITYLAIPFLAPILGIAAGVGPIIGLPLAAVAIVFNVRSMRRFWAADHRFRWAYTIVGTAVIVLLVVLIGIDLLDLLG